MVSPVTETQEAQAVLSRSASTGHADLDAFEEQLRKTGTPSWLAYDLRVMFQAYLERGSATSEEDVAQFTQLLGHEPRTYRNYAAELAQQWVVPTKAKTIGEGR